MGKKPIVSVTYESERISIKNSQLTLLKMCVTSLLCGPRAIYGRFMGFYVNDFLSFCSSFRFKTVICLRLYLLYS